MKEYNEQVVETLDDAGCIIANKNIIIDNLQARIAELEGENARLKKVTHVSIPTNTMEQWVASEIRKATSRTKEQLAAEQLNNKLLREHLRKLIELELSDAGALSTDELCAEFRHAAIAYNATPISTEALDEYVAEKVKEAGKFDMWRTNPYTKVLETSIEQLTKQRDLAVEALEDVRKELQQSNDRLNEEREIWDRVMGDGVKKLERLELELDDCLYVLESLWDKTCNKEVTEKWAGILIRNKRVTGASSAEDSSEQTTA